MVQTERDRGLSGDDAVHGRRHVQREGAFELPLGTPLRELIEGAAGGIREDRSVKVVFSGASNTVLIPEQLDTPLDFESMRAVGSGLGAGGFAVYDDSTCIVVGLTEEAARAQGVEHQVGKGWYAKNTKATISGFTEGLVKLVFRRDDRTLVGVHILGDDASELIHTGQAVIHRGGTIDQFIHATFCAPTRSEAYKNAAYDGLQQLSGRSIGRVVEHPHDPRQA
jgi:hypothetical protein